MQTLMSHVSLRDLRSRARKRVEQRVANVERKQRNFRSRARKRVGRLAGVTGWRPRHHGRGYKAFAPRLP